jgi:hypothetical protein
LSEPVRLRRPAISSEPEVVARLSEPASHGAEPWRVTVASLTAVLCLAVFVVLTLARSKIADRVASPLAEKLAHADRVAYYIIPEVGGERAPIFRLGPKDTSIKLITHLVLPKNHVFRPEEDFAYGIRLTLHDLDGRPLWSHEVNIRTRQSKSDWDFGGWRNENAFILDDPESPEQPREITDDRLTRVRLPEGEDDRLLRLSFLPREPSVGVAGLARVYVREPRPLDDRTLRELSIDPRTARELVDHLTYRDWDQLTEDERRAKLSYVWERLAAEGEPGVDYELLGIYETSFRLPRRTKTGERRLVVDEARSLAVNVIGPAELSLALFCTPEEAAGVEVRRYSLDGSAASYPSSRGRERTLEVPAGVHTLEIESPRRVELTLELAEAQEKRVWLIEADRPKRVDEDGQEVLEPDVRRIPAVWVGGNWKIPPRWQVAGPADTISRTFRFDVRVVHPMASTWWPGPGPEPRLELCFYRSDGSRVGCEPWTGRPARASQFEGLRIGDAEPDASGSIDTRWYAASEPQTLRVVAPEETALIELRALAGESGDTAPPQRLIVRGYGYWTETETVLGEPFREYVSEEMTWRYPPLDTRTWFPIRPLNYDDLQDDKAIADLLAQVRLEPRGWGRSRGAGAHRWYGDPDLDDRRANELAGEDGWDPGPWVTLEPRGIHRRRLILEQLDEDSGRRLAGRWSSSLFTELWPNRRFSVDLSAAGPEAPELHWQVEPRTLGRSVRLHIDDRVFEHTLAQTRGRWRLPVEEGRRVELEFDAPRRDWKMWIDRPVLVASPPVSRRRVIHELTSSLVFPVVKRGPEALTVNLVVYLARRRERAELAVSVDEGAPERRTGVAFDAISVSERSYTIDETAAFDGHDREVDERAAIRFSDLEARQGLPLDVVTVQIVLGEDIVPGHHEVRVELLDGGRVWVRAFHRGVADRSKPAASWTEATRDTGEVEP